MLGNKRIEFKEKAKIWLLLVFILAAIIPFVMRSELLYARHLQIEGVVIALEWKSKNHQLPKITLLNELGKKIIVSHSSLALNDADIKLGDKLVKKRGSNYCLVNGEKVRFSKYLGTDSMVDVVKYFFSQRSIA